VGWINLLENCSYPKQTRRKASGAGRYNRDRFGTFLGPGLGSGIAQLVGGQQNQALFEHHHSLCVLQLRDLVGMIESLQDY
jgi:hypothetical protein